VIALSQKILDLEPHDRATVFAAAAVSSDWFVDAGQAGVPDCRPNVGGRTDKFGADVIVYEVLRKASYQSS